jgi:hypothetical protein
MQMIIKLINCKGKSFLNLLGTDRDYRVVIYTVKFFHFIQ